MSSMKGKPDFKTFGVGYELAWMSDLFMRAALIAEGKVELDGNPVGMVSAVESACMTQGGPHDAGRLLEHLAAISRDFSKERVAEYDRLSSHLLQEAGEEYLRDYLEAGKETAAGPTPQAPPTPASLPPLGYDVELQGSLHSLVVLVLQTAEALRTMPTWEDVESEAAITRVTTVCQAFGWALQEWDVVPHREDEELYELEKLVREIGEALSLLKARRR